MTKNLAAATLFGGAFMTAGLADAQLLTITDQIDGFGFGDADYTYYMNGYSYYYYYESEVDQWEFSVSSAGNFQIDVLAWQAFENWFNPNIFLFEKEGDDFTLLDLRRINFGDSDLNGSSSRLDPFLDIFLTEGDYMLAIGADPLNSDEALQGVTDAGIFFFGNFVDFANDRPSSAQYQIDFYGDGALVIPAPATAALATLGALAIARRRR